MSNSKIPASAKMVFKGVIFEIWQWEQKMFDDSYKTFEIAKRNNSVSVIANLDDKIIVLNQEQPHKNKPFLSLPGGRVDDGESPLEAAKRELLEETGLASDNWTLWRQIQPNGTVEWGAYIYVAAKCFKQGEPCWDSGERMEILQKTIPELLDLSENDNFRGLDIKYFLLQAKCDPKKQEELHDLLFKE